MSDDWDDYGGAKPPSKLTLALMVLVVVFFIAWATLPFVSEFVGAYW